MCGTTATALKMTSAYARHLSIQ